MLVLQAFGGWAEIWISTLRMKLWSYCPAGVCWPLRCTEPSFATASLEMMCLSGDAVTPKPYG